MHTYTTRLFKSNFVRNVIVVAAGTAGAQVVHLAFAPVITRLYGPEAFGVLGAFTAILAMTAPLAALSFPTAIVLPKQDTDAVGLVRLSLVIALITSLLTLLALICFREPIVRLFNLQTVGSYILLLPLAMVFSVCWAVVTQWAIRKRLFKSTASVAVLQAFIVNGTKSGLGLVSPIAATLISVDTIGKLVHAGMLWFGIKKSQPHVPERREKPTAMLTLLCRHKDFALYRTPQIFVNSIGKSVPVLMLMSVFGPSAAGFYTLARTMLAVPSMLIGQSVSDVFYPKFVETVNAGRSGKTLLRNACAMLMLAGAPPYLLVAGLGPWLFSLVFGGDWYIAGEYARWMSLWVFMILVTRPVIAAIPALALQGSFLIFESMALIVKVVAIYVGYQVTGSALGAVVAFSLSNAVIYALLTGFVIHKA